MAFNYSIWIEETETEIARTKGTRHNRRQKNKVVFGSVVQDIINISVFCLVDER